MNQNIKGFSKLSKEEKIEWISNTYFSNPAKATETVKQYWNSNEKVNR